MASMRLNYFLKKRGKFSPPSMKKNEKKIDLFLMLAWIPEGLGSFVNIILLEDSLSRTHRE